MPVQTSVIVPVRNGSLYIEEALDSVLPQLCSGDEVLIVDDASTDGTRLVLEGIADLRIKVLDGYGGGSSSARNIGLASAAGEFVAFLDHDDLWPPARHKKMIQKLVDDQKLDAVFGRIRVRFERGGVRWPWLVNQDGLHAPGTNLGNALYRRKALQEIDGFDETLRIGEDVEYFSRLLKVGIYFALCDVDGLIYRRHNMNVSNDIEAMKGMTFDFIRRAQERRLRDV